MASTKSVTDRAETRNQLIKLLLTTVLAILLGVFEELADPFGLDTESDRLSANIYNSITSPLYGGRTQLKLEGQSYSSRYGQSNIVVLLIDDAYMESVGRSWPLEPRRYQRILRKLSDAGASTVFVDIFFAQNSTQRQQDVARLYKGSACLVAASMCAAVDEDWSCSDYGSKQPCANPMPDSGTEIFFAGTKQTPVPWAGDTAPPASAMAQMLSAQNIYNLRETDVNGVAVDTAGWALYQSWCKRSADCDASRFSEFSLEPMYLHWGYAPNKMMTDIADFGAGVCIPQSEWLIGRLWQSITVFAWNFIRGFHDRRIAPCPYTSQIKLQLFNNLSAEELRQLFNNKVVLLGASLENYPDYQWSPVHDFIPGVFWHAMAIDNLMEFGGGYMKDTQSEGGSYLEPVGIAIIFILQAILTWRIQRREGLESLSEMEKIHLDLLHGLLTICVISAVVLWITGLNRWSPANWIGFAMLMFLIDFKPVTAVPKYCWRILPTARMTRRPFIFASNLALAIVLTGIMLIGAFCIFILPHALLLGRSFNDGAISYTFMAIYFAIILLCGWKICWGKAA